MASPSSRRRRRHLASPPPARRRAEIVRVRTPPTPPSLNMAAAAAATAVPAAAGGGASDAPAAAAAAAAPVAAPSPCAACVAGTCHCKHKHAHGHSKGGADTCECPKTEGVHGEGAKVHHEKVCAHAAAPGGDCSVGRCREAGYLRGCAQGTQARAPPPHRTRAGLPHCGCVPGGGHWCVARVDKRAGARWSSV